MTTSAWRNREVILASALTAVVAVVRFGLGMRVAACGTPDACAYLGLAQSLGQGNGFRTPYLFDLQVDKLTLPTRGIEYWRPGTSFFLLPGKLFGGVTLHSSTMITVLAGIAMAAAAWTLARRATGDRRAALASYALCLVLPPLWGSSLTPDSTLFYGLAVAWFLALFSVRRKSVAHDVMALMCAGVAYMVRNDAVLLLAPLLAALWQRRRTAGEDASVLYPLLMIVGFALALAPTHLMNRLVLGTAFPPGAGRTLYLNDISDFVHYRQAANLHTLLATGFVHLLKVRIATLSLVTYRNLALNVGFALVFLPALWTGRERKQDAVANLPEITGGAAFLAAMLATYTLVLPAIGVFSALRSFVALLPWIAALVVAAVWRVSRDTRTATILMASTIAAYLVSGVMDDRRLIHDLASQATDLRALAVGLETVGARRDDAIVMTADPIQFSVATGFATVQFPDNGLIAIKGLAGEMGVTHVLVSEDQPDAVLENIEIALQPERVLKVPATHSTVLVLRTNTH